ncbi:MAG: S9 family peptidase [Pedobacter sp.]|nr:MAG: S9 family peptidase [Pedobacter sp.]
MNKFIALFVALCVSANLFAQLPKTAKKPIVDDYFGTKVTDNYRWLEDTKDPIVQTWFKEQANYTTSILDQIPGRDGLIQTLKQYNDLKPFSVTSITKRGGRYFFKKALANENTAKLYYKTGQNGKEILLYSPPTIAGKAYSINYFLPSNDGKKIAIGTSISGSETSTIYIMNVDTKSMYPEKIFPSWFGVSDWTPDNKGFIYTVQNSADNTAMSSMTDTRSMYHLVGSPVKSDRLVFSRKKYPTLSIKPEDICMVFYSEDKKYIIGYLAGVDRDMQCFYAPAADILKPAINWKTLFAKKDQIVNFAFNGDDIYMQTYAGAPKFKIIKSNLKNLNIAQAETVIAEQKAKIDNMARSKDFLYYSTNDGINSRAFQYSFARGKVEEISLPVSGTAALMPADIISNDVMLGVTSWKQPFTIYNYNPLDGKTSPVSWTAVAKYPGVEDIIVEEIEIKSHDGVMVPLTIMYNKNVKRDGNAVCFMTGYGAYGSSATPYFSPYNLALLNQGVIVAETHVRGGSEKGEDWYKAGYKTTKPNTWKDFIASGEYLISNNYTSAKHLIGEGTSAGGILIGRAITERPDLFAAAISNVSCSNALRMENSPNGLNNTKEFGTVKVAEEAKALYEMDAMQHVKEGVAYPAVICVGGMNDPRVIVWQPGKFAAALQNASTSGKPVLMAVNYDNGHFTENKEISYRNFANMFSFGLWQAGHADYQPKK